ncbi:MAG: hypothetical protein ABMB14_14840 [Myxococcota bacterium]
MAPLGTLACQEYQINQPPPVFGDPNPVTLENPSNTDKIVQVTTPSVDILWIVDNSSSMEDDQDQLATNFPTFMDYFLGSGLDYHIGVVSTDMDAARESGKLVTAPDGEKYITVDTVDPEVAFSTMARLGARGSGNERGRDAAFTALELLKDTDNAGFLRDDVTSGVHAIIISDENDHSKNKVITKDEFIAYMNDLRPSDELVTFNSIVNPPPGGLVNEAGVDYLYLTDGIGGIKYPLQTEDWVTVLEQLGIQAAGLKREYFLSAIPVVDTIAVQVQLPDGSVVPFAAEEYTYSAPRNSITFETFIPEPLSEVYIQYTVLSSMVDVLEEAE